MSAKHEGKPWSRSELAIVCNFYFTLPFGRMHARNPDIIGLANSLGRTPASVAMKLVNFASLDPAHRSRGVSGLRKTSRADLEVWSRYSNDLEALALESEAAIASLGPRTTRRVQMPLAAIDTAPLPKSTETERLSNIRIRRMQSFFRRMILASYECRCCVTGNPIREILVASHILPWSAFPKHRLNPHNGLCLSSHFDKAFDAGLITFSENLRLVIGSEIRASRTNAAVSREFISMDDTPLKVSERYPPNPEFVEYHRLKIFKG
ncbi:MAG: HNH endonuclease [Terriglobia bacterium]